MTIDWSWWKRLEDEWSEGDWSSFASFEKVMDRAAKSDFAIERWWDEMDTFCRVSLYGVMFELREQAMGGGA